MTLKTLLSSMKGNVSARRVRPARQNSRCVVCWWKWGLFPTPTRVALGLDVIPQVTSTMTSPSDVMEAAYAHSRRVRCLRTGVAIADSEIELRPPITVTHFQYPSHDSYFSRNIRHRPETRR